MNSFRRLMYNAVKDLNSVELSNLKGMIKNKLTTEKDIDRYEDVELCELLEIHNIISRTNVSFMIEVFTILNRPDLVQKYEIYQKQHSTVKRYKIGVAILYWYRRNKLNSFVFIISLIMFYLNILYSEEIKGYYRYWKCTYGCIHDSELSFDFIGLADPYQTSYVGHNLEFKWETYKQYFPTINPHHDSTMHYFLNTDRCVLGNIRSVGSFLDGKKPVRGAEIFAVPHSCKSVWFHDDKYGGWKKYISAKNIKCTKLPTKIN